MSGQIRNIHFFARFQIGLNKLQNMLVHCIQFFIVFVDDAIKLNSHNIPPSS